MIKIKKMAAGICLLAITSFGVQGQKNVSEFLELGVGDAKILSEAYLQPYGEMLGRSLNGGWYNSASVHKVAGFNFTLGMNMSMVPASGKTFDVAPLLGKMAGDWELKDNSVHIAPTAAGQMQTRPILTMGGEDVLALPNGSGFDKFPMPMVQAGVGLPFHTELTVRFVPAYKFSNAGQVSLYGFGVKHSIKEYIPVFNRIPFLQTSVMFGYTNFGSEVGVSYEGGLNQKLDVSSSAFTTRLLVGVNIPFIAVYTGFGYGSSNSDFALKGDYGALGTDPLTVGYTTGGFDANAGVRFRLGIFAIHGDYTLGDYSMASVGVGISFR